MTGAEDFKSRFKQICDGYSSEKIFNADETALFYFAIPNKSLVEKYKKSAEQKFCKERATVLLAASMTGEKL